MIQYHSIFLFTFSLYHLACLRKLFKMVTTKRTDLNGDILCPETVTSQLKINSSFPSYLLSIQVTEITRPSGYLQRRLHILLPLLLPAFPLLLPAFPLLLPAFAVEDYGGLIFQLCQACRAEELHSFYDA